MNRLIISRPTPFLSIILLFFSITILTGSFSENARAQTIDWIPGQGTWDDPSHWYGGELPTSETSAVIHEPGTEVYLPSGHSGECSSLYVYRDALLFLNGSSLTSESAHIGAAGGDGGVIIQNGTWVNKGNLWLGSEDPTFGPSAGSLTISGGAVTSGYLYVGQYGSGTVLMTGGSLATQGVTVGNSDTNSGAVYLVGGIISTNYVEGSQNGVSAFALNGGTL